MTRIAHLEPYLSVAELKHHYRSATNPSEARRWHLLWLIALSKTIKEAAAVLGINYDYARRIVKSYNQQGEIAIHLKKQPPRKRPDHALLNTLQLEELRLSLAGNPRSRSVDWDRRSHYGLPKKWERTSR
jgi:transposase